MVQQVDSEWDNVVLVRGVQGEPGIGRPFVELSCGMGRRRRRTSARSSKGSMSW
jgi:hypothetical protein